jgi:hypothetical protein
VAGAIVPGAPLRSQRIASDCVQTHQAMIFDRGGVRRLWQLIDLSSVKWGRELDGISTAELTILGEACADQADVLAKIEPRRHELVLFRNGERVWEGPIVQVGWFKDRATLLAHDVLEYLKWTTLSQPWPNEEGGGPPLMLDRVAEIITHELTVPYSMMVGTGSAIREVTVPRWENIDPPATVLPHIEVRSPGTVLTRSETEAFEMTVFEHIQNLARGGMDFTAIGRKILFWDRKDTIGRTRTLTDNDFYGEIEVFASGTDHYSVAHVVAQPAMDATVPPESAVFREGEEPVWEITRRNLHEDPRALHPENQYAWYKGYSNWAGVLTSVTDPDGTKWVRYTAAAPGLVPDGPVVAVDDTIYPLIPYRLRMTVRSPIDLPNAVISIRYNVQTTNVGESPKSVPIPAGESVIEYEGEFTQAAVWVGFCFTWFDGPQFRQGDYIDMRDVVINKVEEPEGPPFSGETEDADVRRYSWAGVADESHSIEEMRELDYAALAVGNAGGEDPFYGVWTHVATSENEQGSTEPTQEELNSQAGRDLVGRTPVPVEIRIPGGGGIRPSFDLTIADLIPGVEVPVIATLNLRQISQMQRIEKVSVTETSDTEEVGVDMVPYGDVTGVDG